MRNESEGVLKMGVRKLSFSTRGCQMFVGGRAVNETKKTCGFSKNHWQRGENHRKSSEYKVVPKSDWPAYYYSKIVSALQ